MSKNKVSSHDESSARVVLCVRLPQELIDRIDEVAGKSQRPRSQIVVWAIEEGMCTAQNNAGVVA
jgi:predicted transcriptional regulator